MTALANLVGEVGVRAGDAIALTGALIGHRTFAQAVTDGDGNPPLTVGSELYVLVSDEFENQQIWKATYTAGTITRAATRTTVGTLADGAVRVALVASDELFALAAELDILEQEVDASQSAQDTRLDALETSDTAQDQAIAALDARADETDTEQATQDQAIAALDARADGVDAEQDAQNTVINDLVNRADVTDQEQSTQDGRLDALENAPGGWDEARVSDLEERADETDTEQGVQDGRLDAGEAKDAAQDNSIVSLIERADETDTEQGVQDGRLDAVEVKDTAQDQAIAALDARADETDTEQTAQDGRLDALEARPVGVDTYYAELDAPGPPGPPLTTYTFDGTVLDTSVWTHYDHLNGYATQQDDRLIMIGTPNGAHSGGGVYSVDSLDITDGVLTLEYDFTPEAIKYSGVEPPLIGVCATDTAFDTQFYAMPFEGLFLGIGGVNSVGYDAFTHFAGASAPNATALEPSNALVLTLGNTYHVTTVFDWANLTATSTTESDSGTVQTVSDIPQSVVDQLSANGYRICTHMSFYNDTGSVSLDNLSVAPPLSESGTEAAPDPTSYSLSEAVAALNATDFTGHPQATGTALSIGESDVVIFGLIGARYAWIGPTPALVGVGGTYTALLADLVELTQSEDLDQKTRWVYPYTPGSQREANDMVAQDGWLMVANTLTTDQAAPRVVGLSGALYEGASPPDAITAKQLDVAQRYTWPTDGWVQRIRVYTVAGNAYRIWAIGDPLGEANIIDIISQFTADTDGWVELSIANVLIYAGEVFDLIVSIEEPDPTPTVFTGNWDYTSPQNPGTPGNGAFQHSRKQPDIVRINTTDDDAGDRYAELAGLTAGDTIDGPGGLQWAIQSVQDNTTWFEFGVAPAMNASPTGVFLFTFEAVTATPIVVVNDPDWWISTPGISGRYRIDGGAWVDTEDQYSCDIVVQEAAFSEDWDAAVAPGSAGGAPSSPEATLSPVLEAEIDCAGIDFNANPQILSLTPGYDYEIKISGLSRALNSADYYMVARLVVDGAVYLGADYGYNYYYRRGGDNTFSGDALDAQTEWFFHQPAWSAGYPGSGFYSFRGGPALASFVLQHAGYGLGALGSFTSTSSGYCIATGGAITGLQILSSIAGTPLLSGVIQAFRLPRLT